MKLSIVVAFLVRLIAVFQAQSLCWLHAQLDCPIIQALSSINITLMPECIHGCQTSDAGSWLHVPPTSAHPTPPQSLAPATPPKPASSGATAGNSPASAAAHVGGCLAVDERQRVSSCALEVSPTCLCLHHVGTGFTLSGSIRIVLDTGFALSGSISVVLGKLTLTRMCCSAGAECSRIGHTWYTTLDICTA